MFGQTPDPELLSTSSRPGPKPVDPKPPSNGLTQEQLLASQEERRLAQQQADNARTSRSVSNVVMSNLDTPLQLSAVRILNTVQTRSSFLSSLLVPLLSPPPPPSLLASLSPPPPPQHTLGSLLSLSQQIHAALYPFGIFKTIDVRLETAQSILAPEGSVDVVVDVKEVPRWYLKSGTEVGAGEGGAYVTANVRNVFGGAETLGVQFSTGTKTRLAFESTLRTPLFSSPYHSLSLSAFSLNRDNTSFASHWESARGLKLAYDTVSQIGNHTFAWEGTSRSLENLEKGASLSIRTAASHPPSFKSALTHTFTRDTRSPVPSTLSSSRGAFFKTVQELAGLGGSAAHFKSTMESSLTRALGLGGWFASLTTRSGFLLPFSSPLLTFSPTPSTSLSSSILTSSSTTPSSSSSRSTTHISDRFLLGGPTSVRGFTTNGLGPRDGSDSLGADLTYSLGLSLYGPLPIKPEWPLKLHAFANAGKLAPLGEDLSSPKTALAPLFSTPPSTSVGFGLVYDFSPVRLEANFTIPLVAGSGESKSKGFGIGMGMEFL